MPSSLGAPEILVILVVALIVLGPKRLPEAGRQIGKALSEVRRWSQSVQSEIRDVIDVDPEPMAPTTPAPMPTQGPAPVPSSEAPGQAAATPTAAGDPPGETRPPGPHPAG